MATHRTTKTSDEKPLPRILFARADEEAQATPRGSAVIVATLLERLELAAIAHELGFEKHHGVSLEHVLLVFLLFATYGVDSVSTLAVAAQKDTSLAAIMDGVSEITERVLRFFQKRRDCPILDTLLDRFVNRAQQRSRFESHENGILAVDDSTMEKFGKKMENVAVVYDHCEKRYYLGFVIVTTCYCDAEKAYPVNFQFRVQTEEERRRAEEQQQKKQAGLDFRKKGALNEWLQFLQDKQQMPAVFSLVRSTVNLESFKLVDSFHVPWVAAAHERLPLHDTNGQHRWEWEDLKKKTLSNVPDASEVVGLKFYSKEVSLPGYDRELDFVVVTDFLGQEFDILVLPRAPHQERVAHIMAFFQREGEPEASKLHLAVNLVRRAKEAGIKAQTVAADSWYFVAWFAKALLEIQGIKRVVSILKANQVVSFARQRMEARELWNIHSLKFRHERAKGFKWASVCALIEGLGGVRLVLVRELDKKRPWRVIAEYVVVCTDDNWSPLKVVAAYKLRWGVEVFYRTAKQRFGLEDFHCRDFTAIYFHTSMVFLAYLMTAVLRQMTPALLDHTLGQVIDDYLNCLVRIKRQGDDLIVYVGPRFAEDFGLPSGPSP